MSGYRFDPDRLVRTAALLYEHLPAHLRARDERAAGAVPPGDEALRAFVDVLAAPLAALRQSIEELQGDFFVDTADDAMLPALAQSIGLELVFSTADANRRDLAGAVSRRRRKGTPVMLEHMARVLSDRLVATGEGWKFVQMSQHLNILRVDRTALDLRAPAIAERISGPLESVARSVDPRLMSVRSGRVHPRHIAHWVHFSKFFPLFGASAHRLPDGAADLRFAFDAQNAWRGLRCRATGVEDDLRTDRVPELLFAEKPGDWFARDGRFTVRIANLPAAATAQHAPRSSRRVPASDGIMTTSPSIDVIDYDGERTSGPVEIALMAVPLVGDLPDAAAAQPRAAIEMDITGQIGSSAVAGPIPPNSVAMLRLGPTGGAASRFFAGAVLRVTGGLVRARRPSADPDLAREGYRNGALYLSIPPLRLTGQRWFYIGADGSLHHGAQDSAPGIDLPMDGVALPARVVASSPVGPVWPPAPATADRRPFAAPLVAPNAAPVILHGGQSLHPSGDSLLPASETSALVFALSFAGLERRFLPMLRLVWNGGDPAGAVWEPVGEDGAPVTDLAARLHQLAQAIDGDPADLALSIRFETQRANARFTSAEISFTGHNGRAVLIYTPELIANDPDPGNWPRGPAPVVANSTGVQVGRDGSTWTAGTNLLRRRALGQAVPLRTPIALQRRMPRWRRLCPWQNETVADVLDPVSPGRLDIDPTFGLFAIADSEPPQEHPVGPAPAPDTVSVDIQTGATMAIGAVPLDHDRALGRAPETPTRRVAGSGHLSPDADRSAAGETVHSTLADAFAAIALDPQRREVVEIADSRFYSGQVINWPDGPEQLIVRAAHGTQPVIEVAGTVVGAARYDHIELTGLALSAGAALVLQLPPAQTLALNFIGVQRSDLTLSCGFLEQTGVEKLHVTRSILGPVILSDPGLIAIEDSIVDAGADGSAIALMAADADLTMDRCTVSGELRARQVDISESILRHAVFASERFAGCIRFSALAPGGLTPRKHRVVRRIQPRFVSYDRRDHAYFRLSHDTDAVILSGAVDGGEMGAFNQARIAETERAVSQRLHEHTPAGLRTGLIRIN